MLKEKEEENMKLSEKLTGLREMVGKSAQSVMTRSSMHASTSSIIRNGNTAGSKDLRKSANIRKNSRRSGVGSKKDSRSGLN